LNRIKLVKPQRAADVENRLIMLAQSGQLRAKVTEDQLKDLLGAMADNEEKKSGGGKIKILKRRDDDDDLDDLLAELED
jgi:programmed cell death protein 5